MAEDVSQKTPKVGDNHKLSKSSSRTSSDLFCICGDSDKSVVQPVPPLSSGNNQKKKTSFQITSVTVGSRLSNDGGDDSADDLDESHTDDMSDVVDTSRVTDVENETPSFSEDTFSKEDVFFNSSTSLGSAPVIPTSSQYGLAIVSAPDICNNSNSSVQCGAITNTDLHVTVADSVLNLSVLGAKQHESDIRDIHNHAGRNERFKVVKIESTEPFKRGRWVCMDFLDHSIVQSKPNPPSKQCEPSDNQSALHAGTDSGISVADSNLINEEQVSADSVNSNNHVQNEQIIVASSGLNQSVPGQTQNVPGSNHNISGQNHNVSGPTQSAPTTHSNASPGQTQQFNPVTCSQPQQHAQSMSQIPVQQTTNYINTNQHQSLQAQQLQQVLANANYQVHSNTANSSQQQQHMNVNNVIQQNMPMQQHVQQQFQQSMPPPPQVVQPMQVHNVSQQQFQQQQPQQQQQQQQPPQQVQIMQQIPGSQQQPAFVQQCAPVVGSQPSVVAQQPQPIPQQAQQYYTNPSVVHSSNALSNQVPIINTQNQNLTNMMPVHQPQVVNTSQPQQMIPQQSQPQVMTQPNSMQGQPQQTVPIISQPQNSIPTQQQTNLIQSQPVISQQSQAQPLMNQQQNPIQTQPQQQLISQQTNVIQSQPQHMLAQQTNQPNQPQQMMGQQSNSQSAQPSSMLSMQSQPQQMMQQQAPIQTQQVITQQPTNPVQAQPQQLLSQHQNIQTQMMSQASNTSPAQSQPILTQTNLQSQPQQMMTQPTNSVQPQQLINQQPNNVQTQPQPVMPPQTMVPNQMLAQQMMAQQSMIPSTNHMANQPNNFTVTNLTQSNQQSQQAQHLANYPVSQTSSGHHYVPSSLNQQSYPSSISMLNEVELSENKMMEQLGVQSTLVESLNDVQNATNNGDETQLDDHADSESASGTSAVAIDNKIEQAMDLVKSHLMFAVREEVEVLKEKIAELMERINQLEAENTLLKQNASQEVLAQLTAPSQIQSSNNVP